MKIARLEDIAPGTATVVAISGAAIALFNVEGEVKALDDACIRCGSSLAAGTLEVNVVHCSGCDWFYDVVSGCVGGVASLRTRTVEVAVIGGDIVLVGVI